MNNYHRNRQAGAGRNAMSAKEIKSDEKKKIWNVENTTFKKIITQRRRDH